MRAWPSVFPEIIPPGDEEFEYGAEFHSDHVVIFDENASLRRVISRDDWRGVSSCLSYRDPDYMREQQRLAARSQERRDLVRELMLCHPELTGPQAIEQADEILSTLEGMYDEADR